MKGIKKGITCVLALVMLLSCMVFPASAASHPFTDVAEGTWYADYVQYVYENGLMNGTSETTFNPDGTMTRAMVVTVLHRMYGLKGHTVSNPFTDVDSGSWYYDAVLWAYESGVVKGTSNTTFAPNRNISRQDLVTIFYRYTKLYGSYGSSVDGDANLSKYSDSGSISGYARDAFAWAVEAGIISGTSADRLSPTGIATRAQCAAILQRYITLLDSTGNGGEVDDPEQGGDYTDDNSNSDDSEDKDNGDENETHPETPECGSNHEYELVDIEYSTCEKEGYCEYECWKCGDTYREVIPVEKHDYTPYLDREATCEEEGRYIWKCDNCDDFYYEPFDAIGHDYSKVGEVPATCEEDGYEEYECGNCGDTYEVPIKAGHKWVHHHTDEESHKVPWEENHRFVCTCGAIVTKSEADAAGYDLGTYYHLFHVEQQEDITAHSYDDEYIYVIDTPESDCWKCSGCGVEVEGDYELVCGCGWSVKASEAYEAGYNPQEYFRLFHDNFCLDNTQTQRYLWVGGVHPSDWDADAKSWVCDDSCDADCYSWKYDMG